LGYLEDDEGGTHYIIITKLHLLFKDKYDVKNGEIICYWCKAVFRNDKSDAFQKHLIECQQRISYVHSDFWCRIKLPKERKLIQFNNRNLPEARFESATKDDGKQYPVAYCLFCPDLYFKVKCLDGLVKYYNEDEEALCEQLCKHLNRIYAIASYNINKFVKMKPLSNEQEVQFCKADKCELCK
jgi:hypothetical protein